MKPRVSIDIFSQPSGRVELKEFSGGRWFFWFCSPTMNLLLNSSVGQFYLLSTMRTMERDSVGSEKGHSVLDLLLEISLFSAN